MLRVTAIQAIGRTTLSLVFAMLRQEEKGFGYLRDILADLGWSWRALRLSWGVWGALGEFLGAPGAVLGRLGKTLGGLGASCGLHGAVLEFLGMFLGGLGTVWGRSWVVLVRFWVVWGLSWAVFGHSWGNLRTVLACLGEVGGILKLS